MNNALRRIWLLIVQVIAISAGALIAWRAFGPVPTAAPPASVASSVVAVREAAQPASPSESEAADYPRTRAQWLWAQVPAAQGLVWMSRRLNRTSCFMLFGDRVPIRSLQASGTPRHVSRFEEQILSLVLEAGGAVQPRRTPRRA